MRLGLGLSISKNNGKFAGGLDADAATFISLSGITNATQITAINNIYKDFKGVGVNNSTYNFYTRLSAFWLFVGTTTSNIKYNGKTPSESNAYNLTFSGAAPTISSNGCKFNGINNYADTLVPQNAMLTNTNGFSVYYRENNIRAEIQLGHQSRPSFTETKISFNILGQWAGADKFSGAGGTTIYTNINGLIRVNRGSSGNYKVYRNGSQIESLTAASEANSDTTTFLIGAQRRTDAGPPITTSAQAYSDKTFCFADIMNSNSLSAAEELVYYNCVQAFQTALNRVFL